MDTQSRHHHAAARQAMIDSQLRPSGVNDTIVLRRMAAVPREAFVPERLRGAAYMDRSVPLSDGKFLAPPLFHGMMLELARPQPGDVALIVSGAPDYLAELIRPLVAQTHVLGADEAARETGEVPPACSLLLIDGAVEQVPETLVRSLGEDGRAVIGMVRDGVTCLATGRRSGDALALLPHSEMGIPRLTQFDIPVAWQFS